MKTLNDRFKESIDTSRWREDLSIKHELYRPSSFINPECPERQASLVRCQHAEACRQRDSVAQDKGWCARIAATAAYGLRHILRTSAWIKDTLADGVRTIPKLPDVVPLCAGADVISFDVFDTLLYRTVEPPSHLKRLAANYAAEFYAKRDYPLTAEMFLYLRDESEQRQRRIAQIGGWDTECKLSEVIHEVLYRLFGSEIADCETAPLVDHELKIEIEHLRMAEGVKELLQSLKSQGKRIVVASDTYLQRDHLQQIFANLEIDRWIDAIYASSEQLVGKYSGRLFQTMLRAEGIVAARLIHVGDTYQSDIRGAIKAGVPAVFLFDIGRLRRRRRLARSGAHLSIKIERQPVARPKAVFRVPVSPREGNQPELYHIGRDIMGPAFTLFVLDVIEESRRVGAADMYYLAREGWLFRQLHEILTAQVGQLKRYPPIRHHYLYVSRLATSLAAIRELSQRELHLALYRNARAPLADCIAAFGLSADDFSDLGFELGDREEATKTALFSNAHFRERVHARAAMARARLRTYLGQEGFFRSTESKVLVDIGWNATIQANLTQAFDDDPDFPLLLGYYFGRRYRHEDYLISSRSLYMPGRFFDQRRRVGVEHAIGHCVEIFELAAAAPHGATLNYQEIDGGVQPVLSTAGAELSDEQKLLQAGVVDYAEAFAESRVNHPFDFSVLRDQAISRLAQLILRPTQKQAEALGRLRHTLDWGSQETRPLVAPNMGPMLVFTPARFLGALHESYWLEGCMRISRVPGALTGLYLARRTLRAKEVLLRLHRVGKNFFDSRVPVVSPTPSVSGGYLEKTSNDSSELAGF